MWRVKKSRWTNAKKQVYNNVSYDSGFEANHAMILTAMLRAKKIKGFEAHVPLELAINGHIVCVYKIDFVVYHHDGMTEYIETKGRVFKDWTVRWKLFNALYEGVPNTKITLIMQGTKNTPRLRRKKLNS